METPTLEQLQEEALLLLKRRYVQRADERQKQMGLSYTEAETTELAKTIAAFAYNRMPR